MQRGIGATVFCSQCNNQTTGARLVPMYSRFANAMTGELASNSRVIDGQVHLPAGIEMRFEDCHLGAVARQALAMLMAASGGAALTRLFPGLYALVLVDEGGHLPSGLAMGLRLLAGIRARASGPVARLSQGRLPGFRRDRVTTLLVEPEL
jgi:hypothetical protein